MKTFFINQRMYWQEILNKEYGTNGMTARPNLANLDYWPLPTAQGWLDMCDQAKVAVARYQTSAPEEYKAICTRIEAEAIVPLYLIMDMHVKFISEQQKAEYINRIEYDVNELGLAGLLLASTTLADWVATLK